MGISLRGMAQEHTEGLSDLFVGRKKLLKKDRKKFLDRDLTVMDFDTVSYNDTHFAVVVFEEEESIAYSAGKALTEIIDAYADACGGIREARERYREEEGLIIRMEETETSTGNTFIKVMVVNGEDEDE